jgi:hypothetical protein
VCTQSQAHRRRLCIRQYDGAIWKTIDRSGRHHKHICLQAYSATQLNADHAGCCLAPGLLSRLPVPSCRSTEALPIVHLHRAKQPAHTPDLRCSPPPSNFVCRKLSQQCRNFTRSCHHGATGLQLGAQILLTSRPSTARHSDCPLASRLLQPFVIVGGGRVGQALANMGGGQDVLVRRGEAVSGPAGPIVVCTRNDDLQAVVDATPPERRQGKVCVLWHLCCCTESRKPSGGRRVSLVRTARQATIVCVLHFHVAAMVWCQVVLAAAQPVPAPPCWPSDLVFIQNGMLQPWLDAQGLGEATQVCCPLSHLRQGQLTHNAPCSMSLAAMIQAALPLHSRSPARDLFGRCWCTLQWPRRAMPPPTARQT